MDIKAQFEEAIAHSKLLSEKPSNEILLQLYSLYKQSTEGDVQGEAPTNPFDFVNKAKYDAWTTSAGMTAAESMQQYIDLINTLKG